MSQGDEPGTKEKSPPPEGKRETFGRYRLIERIGAGGMAEIYRAVAMGAQGFERAVAIKRIREEVGEVADIGKLFADEARLSALLNHPNIVQVYDFGAVDGTYYIAMEYLKGRNLDQVLFALRRAGQRLEPALAVFVAHEVARALAYAHALRDEHGRPLDIIHRDISPANIMLLQVGAVKLLDFGIARITSEFRLAVTQGRALRGKCPYLAPEQITGGTIDGRSDIFALGVVLWEMLTGERLFSAESDLDTIASVLNREIPPPSHFAPEVPGNVDRLVLAMLARDPGQRYRSAEVLAVDLDEAMRALPSRQRDLPELLRRLFPPTTLELPTVSPRGESPRFALELPTMAEGPRLAGPRDVTVSVLVASAMPAATPPVLDPPLVRDSAPPSTRGPASTPSSRPPEAPPVAGADEEITARIARLRKEKARAEERSRVERSHRPAGSRRALVTVLGTLVATELLAAMVYRGFGPGPLQASAPISDRAPSPAASAAAMPGTPSSNPERCLPSPANGQPPASLVRPPGTTWPSAVANAADKPTPAASPGRSAAGGKRGLRRTQRGGHGPRRPARQATASRRR
jgi:eukaryotic-like serine/threonine-protein kinase